MATTRATTVNISRSVRPVRLAFLIEPSEPRQLRRALEINTILWGGRYNPIIPCYRRTPRAWCENASGSPSSREILLGYINAYDPDGIVNLTRREMSLEGFERDMDARESARFLLAESDLLTRSTDEPSLRFGLDTLGLYEHLYDAEMRFVQRLELKPFHCAPRRDAGNFLATVFGAFPKRYGEYLEAYQALCRAEAVTVDHQRFFEFQGDPWRSPLQLGSAFLSPGRRSWHGNRGTLMVLDARSPLDLLDFWNLRALGWAVTAVPLQWAPHLLEGCARFLREARTPLRAQPGEYLPGTVLKGRSLSPARFKDFCDGLPRAAGEQWFSAQTWYPRLWDEWARYADGAVRPECASHAETLKVVAEGNNRLEFALAAPVFQEHARLHGRAAWVNVISMRRYDSDPSAVHVLPVGLTDLRRLLDHLHLDGLRTTSEGIACLCSHPGGTYWRLPTSDQVFGAWARSHGLVFELSSPGQIAQQLLKQVGGIVGAALFADIDVIKMLGSMARGKTFAGHRILEGLKAGLNRLGAGWAQQAPQRLERLVEVGALRVGLRIQCDGCKATSWVSLRRIRERIECRKCLQTFAFPSARPPKRWEYRVGGAFASQDYARGSYTVALALRFLSRQPRLAMTATTSFTLREASQDGESPAQLEADFGAFIREQRMDQRNGDHVVFGECKTFGRFEERDIARMRKLGRRFPESILAFATLNEKLTSKEQRLIRPLAAAGRRTSMADRWRNPVLILTATELLGARPLPHCWTKRGGRAQELTRRWRGGETITDACDVTQQLHLGMESYWDSVRRRMNRRRLAGGLQAIPAPPEDATVWTPR